MSMNDISKTERSKKTTRPENIAGEIMVSSADIRRMEMPRRTAQPNGTVGKTAALVAEPIKLKRRSLLQYLVLGSGTFLAGKILGPSLSLFSSNKGLNNLSDFKNFRVVETDKSLSFFDKAGNKIFVIDK